MNEIVIGYRQPGLGHVKAQGGSALRAAGFEDGSPPGYDPGWSEVHAPA